MHTLQVHVPGAFVGTFIPAAAQLNPPDGLGGSGTPAGGVSRSGLGSSQETHLTRAASLSTMQTLHDQVPGAFVGIFIPAAAQLKPLVGAAADLLRGSGTIEGAAAAALAVESGRGSSQATHLTLAASLLTMQVPHVHEPAAFAGGFIPAASQSKATGAADLAPKVKENTRREDGSAAAAALRSFSYFDVVWESVGTSKGNDGRDAESRASAASLASLGTDFDGCAISTKLGTGTSRLRTAGGFIAGSEVTVSCGCDGAGAVRSDAGLAGGGDSGSLGAANPKRSLDGSFGAEDLSGNGGLGVALAKLPFVVGVVFLALGDSESYASPGCVFVGEVGECMSTSATSSTVGAGTFCLLGAGMSPLSDSSCATPLVAA